MDEMDETYVPQRDPYLSPVVSPLEDDDDGWAAIRPLSPLASGRPRALSMAEFRKLVSADWRAGRSLRAEDMARRYGVSRATIYRWLHEIRAIRAETARLYVQEQTAKTVPEALDALYKALRIAVKMLEEKQTPSWVRETRETAARILSYVGVEDSEPAERATMSDGDLVTELRSLGVEVQLPPLPLRDPDDIPDVEFAEVLQGLAQESEDA